MATTLFTANFIGIAFARTVHYQFYAWYWHSLPWLLWRCERMPLAAKVLTMALLEYAWSYGVDKAEGCPTPHSAVALQLAHALLLGAVWLAPPTAAQQLRPHEA